MAKFKVGDKVRVIGDDAYEYEGAYIGNVGTITKDYGCGFYPYSLDSTKGRIWGDHELQLATEPRREFIVIHRDGNVMTAEHRVNRDVIKSAKATCAPSDTFDFNAGAKLAFDRLMGREKPKPEPPKFYTGKVVCYGCEAGTEFVYGTLIGKIGTIKNGHATWRSGLSCEGYTSFDDFCARNKSGRWLEIKE